MLDVEWNGHSRSCPRKIDPEKARAKMRVMLKELEELTGKRPIIYTDITFHKDVIEGSTEFNRYPFWLRSVAAPPRERYTDRPWASAIHDDGTGFPASRAMSIAMSLPDGA